MRSGLRSRHWVVIAVALACVATAAALRAEDAPAPPPAATGTPGTSAPSALEATPVPSGPAATEPAPTASPTGADASGAIVPTPTAAAPAPATASPELAAYLDGLIFGLMKDRHVPGVVALIVQDGRVTFERGYGVADPTTGRPVDPETTLFRVASVSKLFTATAVMQLVEQGKLDLNADLNQYLEGFAVLNKFGKPVTLANLLTHTGGFDDAFLHTTQDLGDTPVPLGTYLAKRMPPQVMPPGDLISYSNNGLALAGYIVERASGRPFAEYVQENILTPLGMTHSGFGLPWPLPGDLAVGTNWKNDRYEPSGYDRLLMAPAGDFYTSAGDMSRFMLAHLADGRIAAVPSAASEPDALDLSDAAPAPEKRLLSEETARLMHAQHFTHHPKLDGWAYGFEEATRNGVRTIEHGGSWRGFGTMLVLVPEKNLGLFVSTTRTYDSRFFDPLLEGFFDRVLPRAEPLVFPKPPGDFASRSGRYTGTYIPNRRVRGDVLKLGLFRAEAKVEANDDGTLTIDWPGDGHDPTRIVEIAPDLFQREDDGHLVAFRMGADGRATHLLADTFAMDHLRWWEAPSVQAIAAGACVLLFALTFLGYLVGGLVRRVFGGPASGIPRWARLAAVAFSGLALVTLAGIGAGLSVVDPFQLMAHIPLWLTGLSLLPLLAVPVSLVVLFALVRSIWSRGWTPLERIHFVLLTLAAAYFAWFCWSWHVVGPIL